MTIQTKDSNQQSLSSRANANNIFTKNSDLGYLPFEDKRDIAIQQRKLIGIVNSKPIKLVAQLAVGVSGKKKKGLFTGKTGGGIPTLPKRPRFIENVKQGRKFANSLNKKKGRKIHMAHRMSWEKIRYYIMKSKGNPNDKDFLKMLETVTVPNRQYGNIPKGNKDLYNEILNIAKNHGTYHPDVARLLNSSSINLRPGDGKINSSIQGKNDYNTRLRKKGKAFVRSRTPISNRLHKNFPDKIPSTKSSSFLDENQSKAFENKFGKKGK